jgi:quinol monooxygenase YgiN
MSYKTNVEKFKKRYKELVDEKMIRVPGSLKYDLLISKEDILVETMIEVFCEVIDEKKESFFKRLFRK